MLSRFGERPRAPVALELQPQVESRAVGIEILPAQAGVEAAEAENEAVVEPVIDPEIEPAADPQARRPIVPHRVVTFPDPSGAAGPSCLYRLPAQLRYAPQGRAARSPIQFPPIYLTLLGFSMTGKRVSNVRRTAADVYS